MVAWAHDDVVALVTGGSDGIGRAVASRLHADGARVAICGRDTDRLGAAIKSIAPAGSDRVLAIPADCRRAADLLQLHEKTVAAFGPVTALVNNVGTSMRRPFLELTDEEWCADFELKVFAAIRLSRMVAQGLIEIARPGRILNVLSIGGKHPSAGSAPTTVSRAAGLALTKVLSKELASRGILVNALCIGTIESGQHDRRWQATGGDRADFYRQLALDRAIPLGRVGHPEEVAALASFLISNEGSYITGCAINVDGGASSAL